MFGIFSNGGRTCTKEDFKHCLLHRLNLNAELSERELDVFLAGTFNPTRNYIDREDFMHVFQDQINIAKKQLAREGFGQTNYGATTAGGFNATMGAGGMGMGATVGVHPDFERSISQMTNVDL